jgi:RNA polymerase sigma-70 factor (ECF subfamily)
LFLRRKYDFNSHSDEELVALYKLKKDNLIIAEFYKRYGHLVFGVYMKYTKNVHNAEDLTIELFGGLSEKIKKHQINHFKSWLFTTTKNSCLMLLRKRNIKTTSFEELMEDKTDEDALSTKEILELKLEALETAINELNENQSICIKAFYLDRKSYDEICQKYNFTVNEVKSNIQNGKRNLKLILSKIISKK